MKKIMFVWGGWEGHQPKETTEFFASIMEKEGYKVEIYNTLDVFLDENNLSSFNLFVLCWTMGKLSPEQSKNLLNAVRSGIGIAGWHGGIGDAFRENTEFGWINGVIMPVVWKRKYGKGRVFYVSFGHKVEDFEIFETREIVKRGMIWACGDL